MFVAKNKKRIQWKKNKCAHVSNRSWHYCQFVWLGEQWMFMCLKLCNQMMLSVVKCDFHIVSCYRLVGHRPRSDQPQLGHPWVLCQRMQQSNPFDGWYIAAGRSYGLEGLRVRQFGHSWWQSRLHVHTNRKWGHLLRARGKQRHTNIYIQFIDADCWMNAVK